MRSAGLADAELRACKRALRRAAMSLGRDVVLKTCVPLSVQRTGSNVRLIGELDPIDCEPEALSVLAAFWRPTTLGDGLSVLRRRARGAQSWVELTQLVLALHRAGILVSDEAVAPGLRSSNTDDALASLAGLSSIGAALHQVVRAEDVVLIVGPGAALHALAVARVGARRVYVSETSPISAVAGRLFQDNGVEGRVQPLPGGGERATVLVAVGWQDEARLARDVESHRHLLEPGARFVPRGIARVAQLIVVPEPILDEHDFTVRNTERWSRAYGIDFSALAADHERQFAIRLSSCADWIRRCVPIVLATWKLGSEGWAAPAATTPVQVDGPFNAVLVHTDPQWAAEPLGFGVGDLAAARATVHLLSKEVAGFAGERITLRAPPGDPTGPPQVVLHDR